MRLRDYSSAFFALLGLAFFGILAFQCFAYSNRLFIASSLMTQLLSVMLFINGTVLSVIAFERLLTLVKIAKIAIQKLFNLY